MTNSNMGALLLSLPECLLGLLQYLDAQGLAQLRRCAHVGGQRGTALAHAARVAELRSAVLELLASTKFPFVHAAYVLGLNGSHYSLDTTAERHYGIPVQLPRLLCNLFKLEVPNTDFTSVRIQKFASAANFGGAHRTLPVNLHTPYFPDAEDGSSSPEPMECDSRGTPAFALCLAESCKGGYGEMCENRVDEGRRWHRFASPQAGPNATRWMEFPMDTWLRWYWPTKGDYYVITATCERVDFLRTLHPRQHRQMLQVGFRLPAPWHHCDLEEEYDHDANEEKGREGRHRSPRRLSHARVVAAKRLLGLGNIALPTVQEIDDAHSNALRQVRDVSGRHEACTSRFGWDQAQLSWASRVLKDAHQAAVEAADQGSLPEWLQEERVSESPIIIPSPQPLPLPAPDP
mmetsp:Transcript_22458/g.53483  ORF Transcript_22458/g.53483 Transcript_22458/m.53483 type:complete len:404 (-) Transcript_22458:50-1261(-)|eukprot:CAMPEP_0181465082 /NCGR_PEP_ID=MMETSP1110-20121109/35768_1 /TAXON_ID=174948 /ORGANISM="Symbiodinium sp., Strain CCMP421" /LENGTH=403 /DNA_ID=CAMNT_0023589843 /DNA_START=62 /DNA_END=1273 /DNA_ORIENTATION=+